ncbi:MAG: aminotransferase class I/II-fold pyridoxal phosphate-dependent enzyme [Elusimicrobia bacterium]|nr:aminotransferase class I/II-fold pyridoxal phosphate-dependent enzyme [Elusimicrobiota bacterium]
MKRRRPRRLHPVNPALSLLPPYLFVALDRKKAAAAARGKDIISLGIGDPDLPTPGFIVSEMARALRDASLHRYPEGRGSPGFRQAVAGFMARKYGVRLDPATEIIALIGSKEGIGHLPVALAGPGGTVYAPDIGYPVYSAAAVLAGSRTVSYPLRERQGFLPDFGCKELARGRRPRNSVLFMNYPNNPTGATTSPAMFDEAISWAGRGGAWLAHDAAYAEAFLDGKRPPSLLSRPGAMDCAIEFHSLSKTFNMTGWRVGWACGSPRAVDALAAVKSNLDSGVFSAVQRAAIAALTRGDSAADAMRDRVTRRKKLAVPLLEASGWNVFPSAATFYLWCRTPGGMASAACAERLLDEAGVLATPGSGFGRGGEGWIRFALTVNEDRLAEAFARVSRIRW